MPNTELLKRELLWLLNHPEKHDQGVWIDTKNCQVKSDDNRWHCGTTGCLAGWVAIHDGWIPAPDDANLQLPIKVIHPQRGIGAMMVERVSADLLGLDSDERDYLFDGGITLLEMFEYAYDITDGAIEIPYDRFDEDGDPLPLTGREASQS